MTRKNRTGGYLLKQQCIKAIVEYFEAAFFMGFSDTNVWYAIASDGVMGDPEDPEDIYKVDSADLITIIHYLIDHRRRLTQALQILRDAVAAGEIDPCGGLVLDLTDAAMENRPGPFENGAGAQQALPGLETED